MDSKFMDEKKEFKALNQQESLFSTATMDTTKQVEQHKDDSRAIQMKKMEEMEREKQFKESRQEKQNPITEKQTEVKVSELTAADMNKEEEARIRNISKDAKGSLKHSAGSDVDNKLKAMANLDVRKKFKTALTDYVNIRKAVLKAGSITKGKGGSVEGLTDKQQAELAEAYEVLKAVIKEYLTSSEATAKFGIAKKNLEMVNRTNELIATDDKFFKLSEYRKTQLEPQDEKKESANLPKLIAKVNKETQEEKKEEQEKKKKEDDKKAADRKEEDMTLEEKLAIYNHQEKEKHVQALISNNIPVPASDDELTRLWRDYRKPIDKVDEDGKKTTDYDWDETKVNPVMKEHYDWLHKYYMYNNLTVDNHRKVLKPAPAIEFKNYTNYMDIPGMNGTYEKQGTNNCYCCAGSALVNQFIAKRKRDKGEKNVTIQQVTNQNQMRAYKPKIRQYDKSYDLIMDKEGYDYNAMQIDEYAGEKKKKIGNLYAMGDFLIDKLKENGIEDVMLNRMVMNVPKDGVAPKYNSRVRSNMKAVFAEKINEIISAGGVASVLTVKGAYAHYVTVTGIKGDELQIYDSWGYNKKSTKANISSLIQGGYTIEISWLSDMKEPEELTKEYKNLQYDEKEGYSVKSLSSHLINDSLSLTNGVTVIKDYTEMGDSYMDISQMAYIPDKKQKIDSTDFDSYVKTAKLEIQKKRQEEKKKDTAKADQKKQEVKNAAIEDDWVVIGDSTATKEKREEKKEEKKSEEKKAQQDNKEQKPEEKKEEKKAEKKAEEDPELAKLEAYSQELKDIAAAKSKTVREWFENDPEFTANKKYYSKGSMKARYNLRQINMLNYFNKMSDEEAKEMYKALMVDTGNGEVAFEEKKAKAEQYEKIFALIQNFDLKQFNVKSDKEFLEPGKKDAMVVAGALFDFHPSMIKEYENLIKIKGINSAYTQEQFNEIKAKWDFIHSGMSWIIDMVRLRMEQKNRKDVDIYEMLNRPMAELEALLKNAKDADKELCASLVTIRFTRDQGGFPGAGCDVEKAYDAFCIKKGYKKPAIGDGWEDLTEEASKLKKKDAKKDKKPVTAKKTAEKTEKKEEKPIEKKIEKKKPAKKTAEEKAAEKFEKDLSAVISKGNKALSKRKLTAMRNNYGLKLEQAATLDLILGVNVRKKEAYEKQLAGIKKLIAASRPKYDQNKKLVNQVLTQFAKLGATERTLDAKSTDLNMVRKGIQACAAYIRNILTDEPVLPEDAVYISQTFKSEVPVTDGKGNAIDMNRPIYMIRHKEAAEKNKKVSSAARLLQRETEDMNFNNIGKYSQLSVTYNDKHKDSWKVSSSIRDIVPILLPLEGNGEIPEEEMKKFAQGQDMILTGRNKETDKKATKEELLDAFNDFLPYFRDRVKELADYKARFSKLCSNNVSYTDIFKMAGNDVRLLMGISQKAQAMGYAVRRILKNPVLMEIIPEDTLKEILDGWNALSPLQGVFGEPITSHYNNICAMTPNELISNGYDGWKTFKTYDERFAEQKVSHEKEFRLARKKADRKEAEKKKAEEEAARKDKRKGSKKKEDKK